MVLYLKILLCLIIGAVCVATLLYFATLDDTIRTTRVVDYSFFTSHKTVFDLNFKYLINSDACNTTSQILAVILVTSFWSNVETRSAMRRAFPERKLKDLNLCRVFLLGTAADSKYVTQQAIRNENKRFKDMVQGDFQEAYRNLTLKHLMGLDWISNNCMNAKYVIKMDDDIVVNLVKVVNLMKKFKVQQQNFLAGYIMRHMTPIREPANKWYVTEEEYRFSTYPQFVSGWFYISSPATCKWLLKSSKNMPYFWIDDLYVTGLLAHKLKIEYYDINRWFTTHPEYFRCCIEDMKSSNYDCDILIGPNGGDNNLYYSFNAAMSQCSNGNCTKRTKRMDETCKTTISYELEKGNAIIEAYNLT